MSSDNEGISAAKDKFELPKIEFGADKESVEQSIADAIEQVPIDDQGPYWEIMDNDSLSLDEKLRLINDLLKQRNGENKE